MSYQVLARKWRPAQFSEVVGQAHIVSALSNALDQDRVHHAFLFTGTRGVGKTTLARIFAKALNCEEGVSAHPCGKCSACVAVAEGRFIDLIEVDAASRTRVDDTRELLENVQYAPTQGRYKVYLIDEVHMLSTHSFNALLKTLEEPPDHVKFLLATTDPQKLPMTVLSRCIQFSLNAIEPQAIETQLSTILKSEEIQFETPALTLLARAADGSLRDALSLLDQAIAYSNQQLSEQSVRDMLGLVDAQVIVAILDALVAQDMNALMTAVKQLVHAAQDLKTALDDLLSWLHALALYQFSPEAVEWKGLNVDEVARLAAMLSPETVQLFYQIGLNGKRDLPLAPDARTGFEMVLLRLMAFVPETGNATLSAVPGLKPAALSPPVAGTAKASASMQPAIASTPAPGSVATPSPEAEDKPPASSPPAARPTPRTSDDSVLSGVSEEPAPFLKGGLQNADLQQYLQPASSIASPDPVVPATMDSTASSAEGEPLAARAADALQTDSPADAATQTSSSTAGLSQKASQDSSTFLPSGLIEINNLAGDINLWSDFVSNVGLSGMARQLVVQMTPLLFKDDVFYLRIDPRYRSLLSEDRSRQVSDALQQGSGQTFKIDVEFGEVVSGQTAAGVMSERERSQLEKTRQDFTNDENVQQMATLFDAQVDESSIKPLD